MDAARAVRRARLAQLVGHVGSSAQVNPKHAAIATILAASISPSTSLAASPHRRSTGPVGPGRGEPVADSMSSDGPAGSLPIGDPVSPWGKPWNVHYGPYGRIVSQNDVKTQTRNGVTSGSLTEGWRKVVYGPRHSRRGPK